MGSVELQYLSIGIPIGIAKPGILLKLYHLNVY